MSAELRMCLVCGQPLIGPEMRHGTAWLVYLGDGAAVASEERVDDLRLLTEIPAEWRLEIRP